MTKFNNLQERMWPNIQDLQQLHPLPPRLIRRLTERYEEGAEAYKTDQKTLDGRPINACMTRDSLKDAEEEVIDTVFNLLVYRLKVEREFLEDEPVEHEDLRHISSDLLASATTLWLEVSDWIE